MKSSRSIKLILMTSISSSLLACIPKQDNQQCVDKDGIIVDESQCNKASPHYNPMYRWYYGGGLFNHGSRATGGSFTANPSRSYVIHGDSHFNSGSKVSRGGFGSIGHGTTSGT